MSAHDPDEAVLQEAFQAFNELSEQLSESYRELQDQVTELTEELDRARSQQSAQRSEKERLADRLESLLHALPAGVVVVDGDGRVQEVNPAAETLLGQPLEGEFWRDVIARAFDLEAGEGYDLRLRDGRLVSLSTCPLGNEPGQIMLLNDVTEMRSQQERASHQKRLLAMGEMAASLAHQVRTPLSSALLYSSHLRRPGLGEDDRIRVADKIMSRMRRLEKLVNDMLVFAKGGIGGAETVPVGEFLQELVAGVESEIAGTGVRLDVRAEAPEVALRCNRELLGSAVNNLATNAIQAMDGEGVLTLATCAADEGQVDIIVADDGPGIDAETRARIFEPFFTTRSSGTGLGLAVVQAVARAHHGDVWLASEPGAGATFGVRLPVFGEDD